MANNTSFIIGVDVGGTHTDCAIVSLSGAILGKHKSLTTADITSGIVDAVQSALGTCHVDVTETAYLSIGTTHFINAVVQRASSLARVVCIRACGVSSVGIPPCADMPEDLRALVCESVAFVRGGFEFDGQPLSDFDEEVVKEQLRDALEKPVQDGVTQVVVSGVFSVLDTAQERRLAELVEETVEELGGEVSVTLSCELAGIGLLERENAGVLNASLKPLAEETVAAFEKSVQAMGLSCPLYLTQNDGTLLTAERARQVPVLTFASGMTNSMRGAAFLTGHKDAIVVDIGGTTTDVGVLSDGFPRPSAVEALVGGVRTSFRMPDTLSIGLGGGSRVHVDGDQVTVGPDSVGFDLLTQARTFGGDEFTATDVAVALRGVDILAAGKAEPKAVSADDLGGEATVAKAMDAIVAAVSDAVDRVKTTATALPLICVGGGSALVSHLEKLPPAPGQQTDSAGPLVVPEHFEVANAIGAAIAQVSGNVDKVIALAGQDRDKIVEELKAEAIEAAVAGGAERSTTHVTSVAETPVPYVPGENVRFQVRAVGSLSGLASAAGGDSDGDGDAAGAQPEEAREPDKVPSATVHGLPGGGRLKSTPNANEEGVWELNEQDVDYIATGAGILGTGGGGDPHYATIRAKAGLREGKPIRVISPDAVAADDLVFPAAFMGAPTMLVEKLVTGTETAGAVEAMSATSQGKAAAVLSCEIGGLNGVEPLITAQSSGLPVCDADLMGRAFPKLDMALTVINGVPPVPAGLADDKGNALLLFKCASGAWLEKLMRTATVAMGCVAALSLPPLRGDQLAANTVPYSVSYAWTIGKAVHEARAAKADPVAAAVEVTGGRLLFAGKVVDVHRFTEGGFSKGVVTITGLPPASDRDGEDFSNQTLKLDVQNEYLMARTPQGEVLACVPDLISVLNTDTGKNVFTESIMFGLRVSVIAMPSHPMMVSEKALKAVGPHAFGYDQVEFVPAE